jgi:hypothetical protein
VQTLRDVVEQHAERCFLDTDGVTRDAQRMIELMEQWTPNRTDRQAGVRHNRVFNPTSIVVVLPDGRICAADETRDQREPALLFSIVAADAYGRR